MSVTPGRHAAALLLAAALPACGRLRQEPAPSSPSNGSHCGNYGHQVSTIKPQGARVDWSWANGLIAYDRVGDDGTYFDVYVMSLDGSRDTCLTCGKAGLVPQKNNGNPAWHPSGSYIVFQSEVASSDGEPLHLRSGQGSQQRPLGDRPLRPGLHPAHAAQHEGPGQWRPAPPILPRRNPALLERALRGGRAGGGDARRALAARGRGFRSRDRWTAGPAERPEVRSERPRVVREPRVLAGRLASS